MKQQRKKVDQPTDFGWVSILHYSVTDKAQQNLLRDTSRNSRFKKVVWDWRNESTLFESDDFVIHHSSSHEIGWFLKCLSNSRQNQLETWEQQMLDCLQDPDLAEISIDRIYRPLNAKMRWTLQDASLLVSELMKERLAKE